MSQAAANRLLSAAPTGEGEAQLEASLRPRRLADYTGQAQVREQLEIYIEAYTLSLHDALPI